jgi:membrane protease YdiL (CAAX protease family)
MNRHVYIVWFGIFLIWSLYRAIFPAFEFLDELLIKPLIFILPVFFVTLLYEQLSFASLGLAPRLKQVMLEFYIGVGVGVLFAVEGMIANYIKYGSLVFSPIIAVQQYGGVLFFLVLNGATAISEEILGRGYLFNRISETMSDFSAAVLSSLLFFLLHVPIMILNLHLRGAALAFYAISIFLLSILNCYILRERNSLVLPILLHLFWNMTVALYL